MIDSKKILEEAKSGSLKKWVEYILRWEGLGLDCTEFPKRRFSDEGEKAYRSYLKQAYSCFRKGCDNDCKGFILMRLVEEAAWDSAPPRKFFLKPDFGLNPLVPRVNIKTSDFEALDFLLWKWKGLSLIHI